MGVIPFPVLFFCFCKILSFSVTSDPPLFNYLLFFLEHVTYIHVPSSVRGADILYANVRQALVMLELQKHIF